MFLIRRRTKSKLVAELKVPPNQCMLEQGEWLADFACVGIPAFVWTPDDWEEIRSVPENGP